MAIHYKDKLKFKFWNPHTAMNAVLDYFEDHNMLEVKTKDDKGDMVMTGSASIGVVVSGDHIIKM